MTTATIVNDRERLAEALSFYVFHRFGEGVEPNEELMPNEDERSAFQRLLAEYSDQAPALPKPRELHEHARASRKGDSPPPAFVQARERLESIDTSRETAQASMHSLIRQAYELGVSKAVLARWSGYHAGWVQQIVEGS